MSKNRLLPYSHWTLAELHTKLKHIVLDFATEGTIDVTLRNFWTSLIQEAIDSKDWNPIQEFNGCTIVQDMFHPCPACFVHDYMWITGHGGKIADNIFFHLMIAEGMKKSKARRRWFAVRIGWFTWFRWKSIKSRNLSKPTMTMERLNNYFNQK